MPLLSFAVATAAALKGLAIGAALTLGALAACKGCRARKGAAR